MGRVWFLYLDGMLHAEASAISETDGAVVLHDYVLLGRGVMCRRNADTWYALSNGARRLHYTAERLDESVGEAALVGARKLPRRPSRFWKSA